MQDLKKNKYFNGPVSERKEENYKRNSKKTKTKSMRENDSNSRRKRKHREGRK